MRQPGFYWVKVIGKWTIEEWDGVKWNDHGCQDGNDYYVSFFEEIDERRIEREPTVADRINEIDEEWRDLCSRMQQDIDKNPEWT